MTRTTGNLLLPHFFQLQTAGKISYLHLCIYLLTHKYTYTHTYTHKQDFKLLYKAICGTYVLDSFQSQPLVKDRKFMNEVELQYILLLRIIAKDKRMRIQSENNVLNFFFHYL